LLPLLYTLGLFLLPRQFNQERLSRMPRGLQTESVAELPEYTQDEDDSGPGHIVSNAMHSNYSVVHTGSDQGHDEVDQAVREMHNPDADDVPLTPIAASHAVGLPRAKGSRSRRGTINGGKEKEMPLSAIAQSSSAGAMRHPSMRERGGSVLTLPRSIGSTTNSSASHHHDENYS